MRFSIILASGVLFLSSVALAARPNCESQFVSTTKTSHASRFENFYVEVENPDATHRVVFFEKLEAKSGKPTLVLLNGLFVPRQDLQAFRESFVRQADGEGLLIVYYSTQMESLALRHQLEGTAEKNLREEVVASDFGREVASVLEVSNTTGPLILVGYSYGGLALAKYLEMLAKGEVELPGPQTRIQESIFLSTLVEASDEIPLAPAVLAGRSAIESLMKWNPWLGEKSVQQMRLQSARASAASVVDANLMGGFRLPDGVDRATMVRALTAQINVAQDFNLRSQARSMNESSLPRMPGAVRFLIGGDETAGRSVAQKAAAQAWGVTPEVILDVPHHALAHKPESVVPILLKRLTLSSL
jgi:pimeloyl-ACP methyl ester carboxylesterase